MADAVRKYAATMTRLYARNLWNYVQQATPGNRTHEDWLSAANRELEVYAEVKVGVTKIQYLDMKEPEAEVVVKLSFEATCGAKLALINAAKGATYRGREAVRSLADCFGKEFSKLVRKAIALEESKDLDEDAELKGVPCEGDPAAAPAPSEQN
jgi:hypothetical protein